MAAIRAGSTSTSSTSRSISDWRWSRSQGTAVNCTRWVSSCRQTQSRKSLASTSSSRSAWTMLGATSSSRPDRRRPSVVKGSNWPSTLPARKPSRAPTSRPVMREPTAAVMPPGSMPRRSCSLADDRGDEVVERVGVGLDPARAVDDEHRRGAGLGDQPGELAHQRGGALGPGPQLGDGLVGLGPADDRTGPCQPGRGRDREVPVDHLRAHAPTLRTPPNPRGRHRNWSSERPIRMTSARSARGAVSGRRSGRRRGPRRSGPGGPGPRGCCGP